MKGCFSLLNASSFFSKKGTIIHADNRNQLSNKAVDYKKLKHNGSYSSSKKQYASSQGKNKFYSKDSKDYKDLRDPRKNLSYPFSSSNYKPYVANTTVNRSFRAKSNNTSFDKHKLTIKKASVYQSGYYSRKPRDNLLLKQRRLPIGVYKPKIHNKYRPYAHNTRKPADLKFRSEAGGRRNIFGSMAKNQFIARRRQGGYSNNYSYNTVRNNYTAKYKYFARKHFPFSRRGGGRYQGAKFRFRNRNQFNDKKRSVASRFKTWYTCKKAFWKRKSFKIVKLYNLIFLNTFRAYLSKRVRLYKARKKRITSRDRRGRKHKRRFVGKQFWHDYFRRNKAKFWFRNKIALRFAWMTRYQCWSHHSAAKLVYKVKRRTPSLLKFWREYEFTLSRYIIWWQIAPIFTKNNFYYSSWLIKNGYVYVNFAPETSPSYKIKLGDCIFFLKTLRWEHHQEYIVNKVINSFRSKFRRGYRIRLLHRFPQKYLFKKKFVHFLSKYKLFKQISHWSTAYFLYFFYAVERSYKYRIFVNLYPLSWLLLVFSTIGKMYYPINYYFSNLFVNRRYK